MREAQSAWVVWTQVSAPVAVMQQAPVGGGGEQVVLEQGVLSP